MIKLSQSLQHIKLIRYQCNYCGRQRKLILPKNLITSAANGVLKQYVDVHKCKNGEYSAIVCFIDNHQVVRSQSRIKATHAGYEPERDFTEKEIKDDPFALFNIPLPNQNTFAEKRIKPMLFFANNIEGVIIKDRLRNSLYRIGKEGKEKAIHAISKLGFVEITIFLKKEVAKELYEKWQKKMRKDRTMRKFPFDDVRKWIQVLADEIESLVTLDEQVLMYIPEYLDRYIILPPDEARLSEIILLINMTLSLPFCNVEQIQRFVREGKNTCPEWTDEKNFANMKEILEISLNNLNKTLQDVYEQQHGITTFSEFIRAFHMLEKYGFVLLHKLVFDDY